LLFKAGRGSVKPTTFFLPSTQKIPVSAAQSPAEGFDFANAAMAALHSRDDLVADPRKLYEVCLTLEQRFSTDLVIRSPTPWATVDQSQEIDKTAERRRKLIWSLELCVRR
jgi:hypothetical protein